MKGYHGLLTIILTALCWTQLAAQETPTFNFNGVVKLRAFIPADARTAKALGTEREGHGVVIDDEDFLSRPRTRTIFRQCRQLGSPPSM